jgi:hypothetical protein
LLAVALTGGVVERLPVGGADVFALALGQLGQQVAHAVHGAVLAVRGGPALLDGLDQPGGAVGDDQHRRAEPAGDQIAPERQPVLVGLAHPEHHRQQDALAGLAEAPRDQDPLLGPVAANGEKDRIQEQRGQVDVVEIAAPELLEALAQLLADP